MVTVNTGLLQELFGDYSSSRCLCLGNEREHCANISVVAVIVPRLPGYAGITVRVPLKYLV